MATQNAIYVGDWTYGVLDGVDSGAQPDAHVRKYDFDGNVIWARQFGSDVYDVVTGLAEDGSFIYVTGTTFGALDGQTSSGSQDVFVRKYDSNGNEIWTQQFGTAGYDSVGGIDIGRNGIYLVGTTNAALPEQTHLGASDVFIRLFDADGNTVWARQFGTPREDWAADLALSDGSVHVIGASLNGPEFQNNNYDVRVYSYDENGNHVWTNEFGTEEYEDGRDIEVIGTDLYIVGNSDLPLPGEVDLNRSGMFLRKYTTAGIEQWTQQFGATDATGTNAATAFGVAVHDAVYTVGRTLAAFPGQTYYGESDAYIRKVDLNGNEVWTRQFGTTAPDAAMAVVADETGVYVAYSSGSQYFVRQYDSDANEQWTHTYDGAIWRIALNSSGLYVLGTKDGQTQKYLTRFSSNGDEIWSLSIVDDGDVTGMGQDGSGVYVTGNSSSIDDPHRFLRKYNFDGAEAWTRRLTFEDPMYAGVAAGTAGVFLLGQDKRIRRYDSDGNEIWTRNFDMPDMLSGYNIALDADHIYALWQASSGVMIRRFDLDGNVEWTTTVGLGAWDRPINIALDATHVYFLGSTTVQTDESSESIPYITKLTKDAINLDQTLYLPVINDN
ncbi:MAG: hypothetical protein R2873_11275 [Caldilineaceae bacterium]